jgi:hypothetical protein
LKKEITSIFVIMLLIASMLPVINAVNEIKKGENENALDGGWEKTYGGDGAERAFQVQETVDGGFIIAGETESYGAGGKDAWLIKTDSNGNKVWDKTYGTASWDQWISVQQTSDEGYILTGDTAGLGAGGLDLWLMKVDAYGNEEWSKTFGGSEDEEGWSVRQTMNGDYIIAGFTASYGPGLCNLWLIRTDENGDEIWNVTFGERGYVTESGHVRETSDGDFTVSGYKYPVDSSYWQIGKLIKVDADGNKLWEKTLEGTRNVVLWGIETTSDNGYILAGVSGGWPNGLGGTYAWVIKTNSDGLVEWQQEHGSRFFTDSFWWMEQTDDGGYIGTGVRFGIGAYYLIQQFAHPYWSKICIVKLDENGEIEWEVSPSENGVGYSAQQTSDGGYIVQGFSGNKLNGKDIVLIKLDRDGNFN